MSILRNKTINNSANKFTFPEPSEFLDSCLNKSSFLNYQSQLTKIYTIKEKVNKC